MSAETEIGLRVYDGCYQAIAPSVANMDQRGRDIFLESTLAAVVAATREFCPERAGEFFRAACLDVRVERKPKPLPRWRRVAVSVLLVPIRHWLEFQIIFWALVVCAAIVALGRPL